MAISKADHQTKFASNITDGENKPIFAELWASVHGRATLHRHPNETAPLKPKFVTRIFIQMTIMKTKTTSTWI